MWVYFSLSLKVEFGSVCLPEPILCLLTLLENFFLINHLSVKIFECFILIGYSLIYLFVFNAILSVCVFVWFQHIENTDVLFEGLHVVLVFIT